MSETNKIIDEILNANKHSLGKHFNTYRNHVYRVFILCQKLDGDPSNIDKYAIASAFHDLGIWTNKTFDYLEPSIALAKEYLIANDRLEWTEEVSIMIDMHHKRSKYNGSYSNTVESFRRADWADVTIGRRSFSLSKDEIQEVVKEYPLLGFHKFLVIMTIKNFFKSPLRPLPMFKK